MVPLVSFGVISFFAACAYGDSLSNCRATDSVCRMHPDGCCDTCRNLVITSTATTTRTTSQTTSKPSLSEGPEGVYILFNNLIILSEKQWIFRRNNWRFPH